MTFGRYGHLFGSILLAIGVLIILAVGLAGAPTAHARTESSAWRIRADMNSGRGDPGVVAFNDKIYAIGGFFSPGFGYPNSLEIYDPVADNWQIQYGLPITRTDLMVASVGNKIYAIGGYRVDSGTIGANYAYEPATQSWITKTSMITPTSGGGAAVFSDRVYIVGGYQDRVSEAISDAVQIYDPATDSWSSGSPMPVGRAEHGVASLGGKIFVIGGVRESSGTVSLVEIYDPATDTWSSGPDLPEPKASMAAGVREGKIYAIGGTNNWGSKNPVATSYEYDPATNSWSTITPLPTARWAVEGAVIGDTVYVVGGAGTFNAGRANEAYPFQPIPTAISVSDSPDPSFADQLLTIDFTVSANFGTPTGIVTVTVSGGSETCNATLTNGRGDCDILFDSPGNYTLNIDYGGDSVYAPRSATEAHTVLFGSYMPLMTK